MEKDWSLDKLLAQATINYKGSKRRLSLNSKLAGAGAVGLGVLALIPGSQVLVSLPLTAYTGIRAYQTLKDFFAVPKASEEIAITGDNSEIGKIGVFHEKDDKPTIEDYVAQGGINSRARKEGICAVGDYEGSLNEWFDSMQEGKVMIVLGRRGSGKTAFAFKTAEYVSAAFGKPVYAVGFPEGKADLLPRWITTAGNPESCEENSFLVIDEAGIQYVAYNFNKPENLVLSQLMQIVRHKGQSIIYTTQNGASVDKNIIRQADSIIFKKPGLMQKKADRPELRKMAEDADLFFSGYQNGELNSVAYIQDDYFCGGIRASLPSFWSEKLSKAWNNCYD